MGNEATFQQIKTSTTIDLFAKSVQASGALLDVNGFILEVSDGWKKFAAAGGLRLRNFGVGQNYLKYTVFPDSTSIEMLRGLKSVLGGGIDAFSTLYPCDMPTGRRWFLLAAFAMEDRSAAAAAVLHIDVTALLRNPMAVSATMIGVGLGAMDPVMDKLTSVVRQAIAKSTNLHGQNGLGSAKEQKLINSLTAHQLSLLRELARGASNMQIAKKHDISLSSAKSQAAALIKKLGVANRTQAALMAARNGLTD